MLAPTSLNGAYANQLESSATPKGVDTHDERTLGDQILDTPYVLAMSRQEVLELFQTPPAPTETELDGEYAAYAHLGHSDEDRQFVLSFLYTRYGDRGYWLGKAFTPISGTGEGYNLYLRGDNPVERRSRFGTRIDASQFDGRPALVMTYASFKNASGERREE